MKQTTLFGTATSPNPTQTNAVNGNKNIKKHHQLARVALSDYFKSPNQTNSDSSTEERNSEVEILQLSQSNLKFPISLSTSVKNSPVSKIAEDISIISIESPMATSMTNTTPLSLSTLEISHSQEKNIKTTNCCDGNGNQITSHFFPKKLSDLDDFRSSFEENENSLNKTKQKKQNFVEGNILNFEEASFVFMLTEFMYDFHEIFRIHPYDGSCLPDFADFCKALQSCDPMENFQLLAPLLVRFISYLNTEIVDYIHEKIDDINSVHNASALLWFYFHKNKNDEVLETLKADFYFLPSEKKIFLLNALLDEVISENNFRTLYDEKLAQVEGVTKKLKCLQANMCKFNKEMASLKLYKTEKLPNANELLDPTDKENVNFNSNCLSKEEDINTRMQRISFNINNTQNEIAKVQNSMQGIYSITFSNKKFGTDSYGRNYYVLKSFSETAVLVELDQFQIELFAQLAQKQTTIDKENEDQIDCNINTQQSPQMAEDSIESNSIVWMEYSTESQLRDLFAFLKTDKCGMDFCRRIEESIAYSPETQSHYLRSVKRIRASSVQFTFTEFTNQLVNLGDDLLSSGLVSTRFDYITWIDTLSNGVYENTTESCLELTHKLTYLIDSLVESCRNKINCLQIQNIYLPRSAPTLSRLFLLLDYYERNIDTVDTSYRKCCRKCPRKRIWDGSNYSPLCVCKECFKRFHLTCQDPPLKDIPLNYTCNDCVTYQILTADNPCKISIVSDDDEESSSDSNGPIRKTRLRPRARCPANNSSQTSNPKIEKKLRIVSSESEGDSPNLPRMELRNMIYQPPEKISSQPAIDYASKLRSACT